jgi:hypothetical protein
MKTGQTVDDQGLYSSECCNVELVFHIGDTFSRCPQCQRLCAWDLGDENVPAEKLDSEDGIAA